MRGSISVKSHTNLHSTVRPSLRPGAPGDDDVTTTAYYWYVEEAEEEATKV
jgi:hypothetical protein